MLYVVFLLGFLDNIVNISEVDCCVRLRDLFKENWLGQPAGWCPFVNHLDMFFPAYCARAVVFFLGKMLPFAGPRLFLSLTLV